MASVSNQNIERLIARGVKVPYPSQVAIASDVDPGRIERGVVLHPGCRIEGPRTLILSGSAVGTQGSTWLRNCGLGRDVTIASGSFDGGVFLDGASHGPSGHLRPGTLFEEGASAGHAVGTKQTILLPFASMGSNVNFCDALLAGGRSEKDHSEVGSGFIHFNFTPFGPAGDKATPSLFGDVARGVWLREERVFLGGAGGVVGPTEIGYGVILAAGGVYRRDHLKPLLVLGEELTPREISRDLRIHRRALPKLQRNLRYMGNLVALKAFYTVVRGALASDDLSAELILLARRLLDGAISERIKQLGRFLSGLDESARLLETVDEAEAKLQRNLARHFPRVEQELRDPAPSLREECEGRLAALVPEEDTSYLSWVRELGEEELDRGRAALGDLVQGYALAAERLWQ